MLNSSEGNLSELTNQTISRGCINSDVISMDFLLGFVNSANSIFFGLTLISAILQIHVLYRAYIHIRGRTADKCLHVFLFSMTFADLILTGFCYPIEIAQKIEIVPTLAYSINLIAQLLCWISLIASSFSLVFLNFDKLAYFRFPLRYSQYFTRRRSVWVSSMCWLISAIFVLSAKYWDVLICYKDQCTNIIIYKKNVHVYIIFSTISSVLPTLTSLLVALYILKIMSVHQKQIKQENLLCSPSHGRQNSVFLARMRTFYFIFMTTIFTAITLLPYRFTNIYRILQEQSAEETLNVSEPSCSSFLIYWIFNLMVQLNSIINPLLTVTILPQYRLQCITRLHYQQPSLREPESTRESI